MPQWMLGQDLRISKDHTPESCSSESDVQSTRIGQETDALMLVGSHAGEDNEVLFSSLESVDRCDFNLAIEVFLETA